MERLAATFWSQLSLDQEYVSKSFIYRSNQEGLDDKYLDNSSENTSDNISEIESILISTEGETLRIGEIN